MKKRISARDLKMGDKLLVELIITEDMQFNKRDIRYSTEAVVRANSGDVFVIPELRIVEPFHKMDVEREVSMPKGWFYINAGVNASYSDMVPWIETLDGNYVSAEGSRLDRNNMIALLERNGGYVKAGGDET